MLHCITSVCINRLLCIIIMYFSSLPELLFQIVELKGEHRISVYLHICVINFKFNVVFKFKLCMQQIHTYKHKHTLTKM